MNGTKIRSQRDHYMLGGGMETAARRGVATARAKLIEQGITPHDDSNIHEFASSIHAKTPLRMRNGIGQTAFELPTEEILHHAYLN